MPSLAGLFGRKKKQPLAANVPSDFDSAQSSPTAEYVRPDKSLPSSPNGKTHLASDYSQPSNLPPSSNKLRLPFTRKKAATVPSSPSAVPDDPDAVFNAPPRPGYLSERNSTSATSDADLDPRRLRPPPSKSAIFAAYGDPHSALSTRSLPSQPSMQKDAIVPPVPVKKSLLNWSRSPKSTPRSGLTPASPPTDIDSFNLKSFRHISSSPHTSSPNASNPSLVPPAIPRPRGLSTASDASQRISVAAFREAQRRSTAGSPVPSNRAPSPLPSGILRSSQQPLRTSRSYPSGSDDNLSEDEDSDDNRLRHARQGAEVVRRQRTLTQRTNDETLGALSGRRATKSEIGHGSSSTGPSTKEVSHPSRSAPSFASMFRSSTLQSDSGDASASALPPRPQSGLGMLAGTRQRASVSTSAISPTAAAKRASILATANGNSNPKQHVRSSSTQSNPAAPSTIPRPPALSDSDEDSDDAPLATLIAPRRPGSALSSNNGSTRSINMPKPLIDINELTKSPPTTSKARSTDGFTPGATLLTGRGMTSNSTPPCTSPIYNTPIPTSVDPPTKFVSPPSSPKMDPMHVAKVTPVPATPPLRSSSGFSHSAPEKRETSPAEQRRDPFGERLNRVVQMKAGSRSNTALTSASASVLGAPLTSSPTPSVQTFKPTPPLPHAASVSPQRTNTTSPRIASPIKRKISPPSTPSPPDEELANMLGGGISLISRTGESDEDEDDDDDDEDEETDEDTTFVGGLPRIAPILIKQRAPPPAFSVTSRPPLKRAGDGDDVGGGMRSSVFSVGMGSVIDAPSSSGSGSRGRQRSSTLVPSVVTPPTAKPLVDGVGKKDGYANSSGESSDGSDQSDSLPPVAKATSSSSKQRSSMTLLNSRPGTTMPTRPFAGGGGRRERESPASSTGDSSSGRAPVTPKDGSEIGVGKGVNGAKERGWGSGVSGLGGPGGKHFGRQSVSFEEDVRPVGDGGVSGKAKTSLGDEERRRERRRSEAKAAIELGNVINGRGPAVDEDDEEDLPINQTLAGGPRMSMMNPMAGLGNPLGMGFGTPMSGSWTNLGMTANMQGWPQQQAPQNPRLLSPAQFMPPMPTDPAYLAAHQQAMMFAKQAYQMAVAQQAMAAAADEWERGSSVGGYGGGGGSVYGGGGGGGPPSVMGPSFGMMGMGMRMSGMGMPGANGWSGGSVIFPPSSRSAYGGISGARSEYGGGGGGGGGGQWSSSKSSYGESFGPSNRHGKRDSGFYPPVPPIPQNKKGSSSGQSSPRSRTASQPATPGRGVRKTPPPSSWKAGT